MQKSGFSLGGLIDELPVVLKPDKQDPDGMQVYTFYGYNYPAARRLCGLSQHCGIRGALTTLVGRIRELLMPWRSSLPTRGMGSNGGGPFRQPLVSLGTPGSGFEGQIYGAGLVESGEQLFLYYNGLPSEHMSRDKSVDWTCITARAIFRLDGFVSADVDYVGGEFTTPLLTFTGSRLRFNAKTGGGGYIRTEILDESGKPIPGFTLAESDRINGNSVHHLVSWKSQNDVTAIAGKEDQAPPGDEGCETLLSAVHSLRFEASLVRSFGVEESSLRNSLVRYSAVCHLAVDPSKKG